MKSVIELIGGIIILLFCVALSISVFGTLIELILYDGILHEIFYAKMYYSALLFLIVGIIIFFFTNLDND